MTLDMKRLYRGKFTDAYFIEKEGLAGRAGTTRRERYRALNCSLEISDESGNLLGVIPWGISVVKTTALIRFFKSIGLYFSHGEFNPKADLVGIEAMIAVNNVCDDHYGIRTVVYKFFPATQTRASRSPHDHNDN